jgi:hypothetical protein
MVMVLGVSFIVPSLYAATLSFLIMETGVDTGPIHEYSQVWENALMDLSFDLGHIISNAPILQVKSAPAQGLPAEAVPYRDAVSNGNFEFFVLVVLQYENEGSAQKLRSVVLKLYRVKPFVLLSELVSGAALGSAREEFARAKGAAQVLFSAVP